MYSDIRFENCSFEGNGALYWVMIDCVSGTPAFTQCTFMHNNALTMYLDFTNAKITNCLFHGNVSAVVSGAPYPTLELRGGMPAIVNCTMTGNTAGAGTAAVLLELEPMACIRNTILWGNAPQEIMVRPGETNYSQVTYCDVAGGYAGTGNINSNPLFVNAVSHDFDLGPGSPCIDAANNTVVPAGVLTDLPGRLRFVNDPATPDTGVGPPPIVDMGAYEFQAVMRRGDLNCDGAISPADISLFALALTNPGQYTQEHADCDIALADLNQDGLIDGGDIEPFIECLLTGTCG